MRKLGEDYRKNVAFMNERLRVEENFDVLSKTLRFADGEATLYYIDGFVKDTYLLEDDVTSSYCYPAILETEDGFLVSYYHSDGGPICLNATKVTKVYKSEISED